MGFIYGVEARKTCVVGLGMAEGKLPVVLHFLHMFGEKRLGLVVMFISVFFKLLILTCRPQAEVRDIGVFADAPPVWLREEQESVKSEVADKLNWEAFLDALGMKPLSPCTFHRKVAGTVLKLASTCQHGLH